MLIANIKPYSFNNIQKISFKSKAPENTDNIFDFDKDYKKFSKMQRNYYTPEVYNSLRNSKDNGKLQVVLPVNGDDLEFLKILNSKIRKLSPKERILQFNCPNYTIDECICSDKGYTDGICDCIAVLLYNKEKAYLYHLNPFNYQNSEEIEKMQQALKNSIYYLEENNQRCYGFLYGGLHSASDKLYENICEVLDSEEIKRDEAVFSAEGGNAIYFDVNKGIILSDEIYAYHSKQQLEENFAKVDLSNYFYSEIL